jgi:hypothetical protein
MPPPGWRKADARSIRPFTVGINPPLSASILRECRWPCQCRTSGATSEARNLAVQRMLVGNRAARIQRAVKRSPRLARMPECPARESQSNAMKKRGCGHQCPVCGSSAVPLDGFPTYGPCKGREGDVPWRIKLGRIAHKCQNGKHRFDVDLNTGQALPEYLYRLINGSLLKDRIRGR